jgi:hypothetical protein
MLLRIVSMLTKLVDRFEGSEFREEPVYYKVGKRIIEDEDEEEDEEEELARYGSGESIIA